MSSAAHAEASLRGYYARRAQEYERIYTKPERQEDLRSLRDFVGRTFAGKDVLEIACGTGYWTEILSQAANSVSAIDINEEVLAIARSKPMDQHKVTILRGDAYALPEFPKPFSAGLAVFWWSHVLKSRQRDFLKNLQRAFAPGATIVFIDNTFVAGSSTPISRTDNEGNTYQMRKLDDGSTHEVLKNFPTEDELRLAVDGLASHMQVKFLPYYWILTWTIPEKVSP